MLHTLIVKDWRHHRQRKAKVANFGYDAMFSPNVDPIAYRQ